AGAQPCGGDLEELPRQARVRVLERGAGELLRDGALHPTFRVARLARGLRAALLQQTNQRVGGDLREAARGAPPDGRRRLRALFEPLRQRRHQQTPAPRLEGGAGALATVEARRLAPDELPPEGLEEDRKSVG